MNTYPVIDPTGEYISLFYLVVLMFFSRQLHYAPTFRNRLFKYLIYIVLATILVSIASSHILNHSTLYSDTLISLITHLSLLTIPLIPTFFSIYAFYYIYDFYDKPEKNILLFISPTILLWILIFINLVLESTTGQSFVVIYLDILYFLLGMYYLLSLINIIRKKKDNLKLEHFIIIFSYSTLLLFAFLIYKIIPRILLSGTIATISITILFLYLQTRENLLDTITNLPNRFSMISTLKYYTKKNEPIGIILISLSNVSEINDKCGYEFGDIFLKEFSDFLASSFGKKNSFRYTNTEFVIILQDKEHTNYNEAIGVIKSKIENGWIICGETSNVECSFATMEFPNSLKSFEDIITVLDHYTSKSKNVLNREVLYVSDDILLSIKRRNMVIQELRNQVLSQTIIVEYQPIYSLKKKRYLNIEALMRLNIKNFGSISPNEFIPLAEDTYLIIELGNILVSEVCNLMKMLEENNIQYEKLSVNISSIQLFDKAFAKNLTRILKDNDISANKLNLELTESIMISDYDDLYNTIKELRSRGFGISLDDYGTGYSNYVKLAKLPFDEIKIDKSILHYIMSVETEYITLSNIIKGFKNRGLNIVMEGVETEEHYKISNALSVDLIQGYYFSRPLEKEELIRFLITSN